MENYLSTPECIDRARKLQRTLGTRAAAGFLRNQRFSVLDARFILLGARP